MKIKITYDPADRMEETMAVELTELLSPYFKGGRIRHCITHTPYNHIYLATARHDEKNA